jgi:hypothetical protein
LIGCLIVMLFLPTYNLTFFAGPRVPPLSQTQHDLCYTTIATSLLSVLSLSKSRSSVTKTQHFTITTTILSLGCGGGGPQGE